MKFILSKSQWNDIGNKAGWNMRKKAYTLSSWDEISIGPNPNGEDCAQTGSKAYDATALSRMENKAYIGQLMRMFPNIPQGVSYFIKRNPHDFGDYYDVAIKFDGNNEEATKYAYEVEAKSPEFWDETARQELEAQGYFTELAKGKKDKDTLASTKMKITKISKKI